jgi:hypothetical protein
MKLLIYVVIAIIVGAVASWFMNALIVCFFHEMGFSVHTHGIHPSYLDVILIGCVPILLRLDRHPISRSRKLAAYLLFSAIVLAFWIYGTYSWVSSNAALANNNVFYLGTLGRTDVTNIQAYLATGCAFGILASKFLILRNVPKVGVGN